MARKAIRNEREALRILQKVQETARSARKVDFGSLSFGPQRNFIEDDRRFIAAVCGRRAGKTDGMALKALRIAHLIPHSQIPYITNSRPQAKRNFWPKLLQWNRRLELGAKFNAVDLTMTLKNGSQIILGGANDESEIERYRGSAYPLVIIDEAQSIRSFLQPLVEEILAPATLDYAGQIVLIGTPNPSATGFFFEAATGRIVDEETGENIWATHHWTGFDNPNLDRAFREGDHRDVKRALEVAAREIDTLRRLQGLRPDDPKYLRETLGQWVRNEEGLVFPIPDRALIDELPQGSWTYVLGVDVGYVDATAFVVLAYNAERMQIVVVESYQKTEMIPSAVAAEVDKLVERWDIESVVVDPGGGGKAYVEEMKQKYGLPAKVAQKKAKIANIEMFNGDVRAGVLTIVAPRNKELLEDARLLQWDYERIDKRQYGGKLSKDELRINDRTPDHLLDAMLYGYRECKAMYDPEIEGPRPGTPEWIQKEEEELIARARRRAGGSVAEDQEWWELGF